MVPTLFIRPKQRKYSLCCTIHGENASLAEYFSWIADEVKDCGSAATRTIIYTQTIKQCAFVYSTLKTLFGDKIYSSEEKDPKAMLPIARYATLLHPTVKQGPHPCILPE